MGYNYSMLYSPVVSRIMSLFFAKIIVLQKQKKLLEAAKKEYYNNGSTLGSFRDYKQALKKHWVSYSEYAFQYEFFKKTEEERAEFVSRLKMANYYRIHARNAIVLSFWIKHKFLTEYCNYIHRQWLYIPDASFEEFEQMVTSFDCIVKPCNGTIGRGIFKVYKNSDHKDDKQLYDKCVENKMLIEECIESCEVLKALHPQSLNTIRVVTVSNQTNAEVFGSFIRMGVGNSVVDNAHAGGVFAQIDIKTGMIESDGIDVNGHHFIQHPDTKIYLKGFQIPQWNEIIATCLEAAKKTPLTIVGWDVSINSKGQVEFVEGNSRPDFDVMQSPLQIGVKKKLFAKIKEYSGVEMK